MEKLGIDPSASRMLSERSTTWATSPTKNKKHILKLLVIKFLFSDKCR